MKKTLVAILLAGFVAPFASAASLPTGSDEIRMPDGTVCRSSTASDAYVTTSAYSDKTDDAGVKVELVIPISGTRNRVDCTKFADLAIRQQKAQIELLEKQLADLQSQQNTWE